ncbi:hypothetical protein HK414_22905 [Ramlibacter terrae]|uniref:Uncharacterized protein n=1 Tax=Ramlibacter terrae TaxID=2732511 RepID=A0ABX6P555_9BURK|nr:hypothetical protein HK414_22905 [Ramlibacter terrae]
MAGTACMLAFGSVAAHADAGELRAKHVELREQLRNNPYQRALHIDSSEASNALQGDVYAVIEHPFEKVRDALKEPSAWCDVMLLPFNTKYCRAGGEGLAVRIGRKYNQPVEQAFRIGFQFNNVAATSDYRNPPQRGAGPGRHARLPDPPGGGAHRQRPHLHAPELCVRLWLREQDGHEHVPVHRGRRQDRVQRDGQGCERPAAVHRGHARRDRTQCHALLPAIDAYPDNPGDQQVEQRIQQWFTATEKYPRQLREMDRATYVAMKRSEYERQQTAALN